MATEADRELEEQFLEAGNKLVDPPSSVEELLPLLDSKPAFSFSTGLSSDLDMIANDQQIPNPACSSVEHMPMPISEHISSQCVAGTELPHRFQKRKKEINLPRRASKRLAGIKVDLIPELPRRSRARGVAGETITSKLSTVPEKLHEKTAEENGISNKDQACFPFLPHQDQEKHATDHVLENGDKVDGNLDYSLDPDIPLGELLKDPCSAFAIQTLTGGGYTFEIETSQIPQEHIAGGPQIDDDMANEKNKGSSSEKTPDMNSWMDDPCIQFAIKILNDTIPLDSDQIPKN